MTADAPTYRPMVHSYPSSRVFDYGADDDVRYALKQLRFEIATRIRQAADLDPTATDQGKVAYELAARIAESVAEYDISNAGRKLT